MSVKFSIGVKILGFLVFFMRIRQKNKATHEETDGLYVLLNFLQYVISITHSREPNPYSSVCPEVNMMERR